MTTIAPPIETPNSRKRTREHLLPQEIEAMLKVARTVGRHGNRDASLMMLAYRHDLRVSELVALRWEQVNFSGGTIYINRLKQGAVPFIRYAVLRCDLSDNYSGSTQIFLICSFRNEEPQ